MPGIEEGDEANKAFAGDKQLRHATVAPVLRGVADDRHKNKPHAQEHNIEQRTHDFVGTVAAAFNAVVDGWPHLGQQSKNGYNGELHQRYCTRLIA